MRRFLLSPLFLAAALGGVAWAAPSVPTPAFNPPNTATSETAILSGGCFWGVQGVYEHVKGVTKAVAGYTGGAAATAQYEIVSTGTTGHAESVEITFDPRVISYGKILQIYFAVTTDPTELNYQGPDDGTQYRGVIWTETPMQKKIAKHYIAQLTAAHAFPAPIVTRVDTAMPFYEAETYHQDFLVRHPDNPYIAYNDIPKVEALQTQFPSRYRADAVTV
ncbi:MAG: peptide-methionine (S)-S-oxide reductase MsrA, partial [Rhodospirillales bacterium]|nr:peptide-methionine (S)-S-oxide reductase MsrA [Rhodospirillales bacterium]